MYMKHFSKAKTNKQTNQNKKSHTGNKGREKELLKHVGVYIAATALTRKEDGATAIG